MEKERLRSFNCDNVWGVSGSGSSKSIAEGLF
jgi:hypothetical protein